MSVKGEVESLLFNQSVDAWTCLGPWPTRISDATVRVEKVKTGLKAAQVWDDKTKFVSVPPKAVIEKNEWDQFWNFFENTETYYTESTYRKVKENEDWRKLYHVAPRVIWFVRPEETKSGMLTPPAPFQKLVNDTIYCKACGILAPLSSITIDHQNAQKGGGDQAIEKLFKACSLSRYSSTGRKGKFWGAGGDNPGFDHLPMDVDLPSIGDFTWRGVIFYSLIVAANRIPQFKTVCLNHAVNLQPMCASCNTSKGNWAFV
jgi:hypothetical protein